MKQHKTSLFVVIDPTSQHQLALVKALLIAKLGNCHIHAFLCVYRDMDESGAYASRKEFKRQMLTQVTEQLEEWMQPCRMSGVSYSTEVLWNSDWVKSVVRSVRKSGCELLVKSSYQHSRSRRFFGKTSDYYLMHHCPCPILFTHQDQEWKSDRVLACIDLESTDSHHARLNAAIVRDARGFASVMAMDLYIASVCESGLHDSGLKQVCESFEISEDRVLLRQGSVAQTLRSICDEIDPGIVVMGTLAQRGIKGKLIGDTAEKLLDVVNADLLTVN